MDIWFEYIQFTITGMGEANGIEKVREICERAVSLAGLHVNKGHFLWGAYRDFEFALLAGYQVIFKHKFSFIIRLNLIDSLAIISGKRANARAN